MSWTIETSLKSKLIKKTFFSSDSFKYIKLANKYQSIQSIKRSKKLSTNYSQDYDVIKNFLDFLKKKKIFPEIIVHLRPTTPLRDYGLIDKAIKFFVNNKKYTSLRSVHKMSETAFKSLRISKTNILKPIINKYKNLDKVNLSRQLYPATYQANGYIDIYRTNNILKNKTLLGEKSYPFITDFQVELDTLDDLDYLNFKINKKKNVKKKIF